MRAGQILACYGVQNASSPAWCMGGGAGCLDDLWSSGEDRVLGDVVESFRIKAAGAAPLLPA